MPSPLTDPIALILVAWAISYAVVFYGFFAGWFDLRIVKVTGSTLLLSNGATLTMHGNHGFCVGDRISIQ